jgi:hypothetical protein
MLSDSHKTYGLDGTDFMLHQTYGNPGTVVSVKIRSLPGTLDQVWAFEQHRGSSAATFRSVEQGLHESASFACNDRTFLVSGGSKAEMRMLKHLVSTIEKRPSFRRWMWQRWYQYLAGYRINNWTLN